MQERYTSNGVIERGYAIYDEWNENKYKSRKIVNSVQMAVASSNAKKTPDSHVTALSHLFALDLRIKERYDNIFKCIILYFSWRRETGAFKRLKALLKLPDSYDIRTLIEIELIRIGQDIDEEKSEDADKKHRGGKVNENSGEEAALSQGEQQAESAAKDEIAEGRSTESREDKQEEASVQQNEEQAKDDSSVKKETAKEYLSVADDHREKGEGQAKGDQTEGKTENFFDTKKENNGSDKKSEPSIDKFRKDQGHNEATDAYVGGYEDTWQSSPQKTDSFIDEVIMDNMIKGESDIIGHNPLEDVKREDGGRTQMIDALGGDKNNEGGKDAHLYDKMVLNYKGENSQNASTVVPTESNLPKNEPTVLKNESIALENESSIPRENTQVVINDKSGEARVQIKVEENLSEENMFRRSVNDQFNEKMINLHKSLMEEALRKEFIIPSEKMGSEAPVR